MVYALSSVLHKGLHKALERVISVRPIAVGAGSPTKARGPAESGRAGPVEKETMKVKKVNT